MNLHSSASGQRLLPVLVEIFGGVQPTAQWTPCSQGASMGRWGVFDPKVQPPEDAISIQDTKRALTTVGNLLARVFGVALRMPVGKPFTAGAAPACGIDTLAHAFLDAVSLAKFEEAWDIFASRLHGAATDLRTLPGSARPDVLDLANSVVSEILPLMSFAQISQDAARDAALDALRRRRDDSDSDSDSDFRSVRPRLSMGCWAEARDDGVNLESESDSEGRDV